MEVSSSVCTPNEILRLTDDLIRRQRPIRHAPEPNRDCLQCALEDWQLDDEE